MLLYITKKPLKFILQRFFYYYTKMSLNTNFLSISGVAPE